jgi:hypothetical protein
MCLTELFFGFALKNKRVFLANKIHNLEQDFSYRYIHALVLLLDILRSEKLNTSTSWKMQYIQKLV